MLSCLNREADVAHQAVSTESRRNILYFACSIAQAQMNTYYRHLTKFTFAPPFNF